MASNSFGNHRVMACVCHGFDVARWGEIARRAKGVKHACISDQQCRVDPLLANESSQFRAIKILSSTCYDYRIFIVPDTGIVHLFQKKKAPGIAKKRA
jgi:hypothetical protein